MDFISYLTVYAIHLKITLAFLKKTHIFHLLDHIEFIIIKLVLEFFGFALSWYGLFSQKLLCN